MEWAGDNDLLESFVVFGMASSTQEFLHHSEVSDWAVLLSEVGFGTFLFVRVVPQDHLFGSWSAGFDIDVDVADLAAWVIPVSILWIEGVWKGVLTRRRFVRFHLIKAD